MTAKQSKLVDRIGAFVAVPLSLARAGYLSPNAKAIFMVLRSYPSSNEAGIAFPSYDTLMQYCGFKGRSRLAHALRELEVHGWIAATAAALLAEAELAKVDNDRAIEDANVNEVFP